MPIRHISNDKQKVEIIGPVALDPGGDPCGIKTVQGGLCTAGRMREVTVTDTWTDLSGGGGFNRNAIAIQHKDDANPIKVKINWPPDVIGGSPVGWVGMVLEFDEERQYDISQNITPYARVDTGAGSVTLFVEELD